MRKEQTIDGYRGYWIGCEYDENGNTLAFVATDAKTKAEIAHPSLEALFRMIDELVEEGK